MNINMSLKHMIVNGMVTRNVNKIISYAFQFSIGGSVNESGERTGMSIPVSTVVLGLAVILICILRRKIILPNIPIVLIACLSLFAFGLLGLSKTDLAQAIKELIQIVEIFCLSSYLAMTIPTAARKRLFTFIGWLCLVFSFLAIGKLYENVPFVLSERRFQLIVLIL